MCIRDSRYAEWSEKTGHSNLTPVIETAQAAGVKRLILTHFDPQTPGDDPVELGDRRSSMPVEMAEDLRKYQF